MKLTKKEEEIIKILKNNVEALRKQDKTRSSTNRLCAVVEADAYEFAIRLIEDYNFRYWFLHPVKINPKKKEN